MRDEPREPSFPPGELFWTGMDPVKAKMASSGIPPVNSVIQPPAVSTLSGTTVTKKSWCKRVAAPSLAFLAAFSIAMALLILWSEATAMRRQAFDANMTRDYVLDSVSMDNPELVAYIREVQLKPTTQQDPLNATQTVEESYVASLTEGKREGVYVEYISRIGVVSSTGWLERNLSWRGVIILTDPRRFFEAHRSTRNLKTRVLHACLSTDKDTKEITYHQESEVQVTKLGEGGPNSLVSSSGENLPTTRLKCFPLYSVLLASSATVLDYLSLDSPDAQDGQVLDTIPWETTRISVVSIRWSTHHSETETKGLIDKMTNRRYKLMNTTDTGKLIFMYNAMLKI